MRLFDSSKQQPVVELSPATKAYFDNPQNKHIIIDVRTPEEYAGPRDAQVHNGEHIRSSINVPLDALPSAKLLHVPPHTTAVFHCRSGGRTTKHKDLLLQWAAQNKFASVCFIQGGIAEWKTWGNETVVSTCTPSIR